MFCQKFIQEPLHIFLHNYNVCVLLQWSAIITIYNNYGNSQIRAENKDDAANCNSLPKYLSQRILENNEIYELPVYI